MIFGGDGGGPVRTLFHPESHGGDKHSAAGSLNAMRYGDLKLFWRSCGTQACDRGSKPTPQCLDHAAAPLAFIVTADPGETTPVTVPPAVLRAATAARDAKIADIAATLHHVADYKSGGHAAAPCCNRDSWVCRCAG